MSGGNQISNLFKRPMFWRILLAFIILGNGHKVSGLEEVPAPVVEEAKVQSWSVVITPDNPETEATVSTFTADEKSVGGLNVETQVLVEEYDPLVKVEPEVTGTFPSAEQPAKKETPQPQIPEAKPCCEDARGRLKYNLSDYVRVYNSIPFSRSLYDVNPSYRHDATIEILLGQPKPVTKIMQDIKVQTVTSPYDLFYNPYANPWYLNNRYSRWGANSNYSLWTGYRTPYSGYTRGGFGLPGYYLR